MNTFFFSGDGKCVVMVNSVVELDNELGLAGMHNNEHRSSDCYLHDGVMYGAKMFDEVVSINTVSNLPVGTTVICNGDLIAVSDGTLELVVDYQSTMSVILTHPHYIDKIVEVPCEA